MMIRNLVLLALGLGVSASPAAAQTEVELDPFTYALNGYSLHVARVMGSTRLNVGVFGADVPQAFHGNDGWSSTMRGAGVKWDSVGRNPDGLSPRVGISHNFDGDEVELEGERFDRKAVEVFPTVHIGWRF